MTIVYTIYILWIHCYIVYGINMLINYYSKKWYNIDLHADIRWWVFYLIIVSFIDYFIYGTETFQNMIRATEEFWVPPDYRCDELLADESIQKSSKYPMEFDVVWRDVYAALLGHVPVKPLVFVQLDKAVFDKGIYCPLDFLSSLKEYKETYNFWMNDLYILRRFLAALKEEIIDQGLLHGKFPKNNPDAENFYRHTVAEIERQLFVVEKEIHRREIKHARVCRFFYTYENPTTVKILLLCGGFVVYFYSGLFFFGITTICAARLQDAALNNEH